MTAPGLIALESMSDFASTVGRLENALSSRGIAPIARIDHTAGAASAGLELSPILVILFGNPGVGTLLMQENPVVGIDLPLRIMVWTEGARTFVARVDPHWIAGRHEIVRAADAVAKMAMLLAALATEACSEPET